ncbi:MAG: beta-galactosidase [Capsulimonadaceae bacterium]|nr:beta-galactosidase [Capsulimonadaceae bacterium]
MHIATSLGSLSRQVVKAAGLTCAAVMVASAAPAAMSDQLLRIPDCPERPAAATVGTAAGTLSVDGGVVHLTGSVESLGLYVDENQHSAAVLDYYLPQPAPLSAGGDRFGLSAICSPAQNPYPYPALRVLFKDAHGTVWAANTKQQGMGVLPATAGYEQVETYPYTANELGRVTPWMLNRADGKIDEFDSPCAPLALVGFRLIVSSEKSYTVSLRDVRWIGTSRFAEPYWLFTSEPDWAVRDKAAGGLPVVWGSDRMNGVAASRFGIGPNAPRPFLRASDLNLAPGAHRYDWEILRGDGWQVVETGRGTWTIASDRTGSIEFPILPAGTYHLRVNVWSDAEAAPRQLYACYVIVRSDVAHLPATTLPGSLVFTSSSGANVFRPGKPALVHVAAPGAKSSQAIEWTLQAADQTPIDSGLAPATSPSTLDLAKYRSSGPAFWLTSRLLEGGNVVAVGRRVLGVAAAEPASAHGKTLIAEKSAASDHRISRTKCDWNEGSTPVVSQQADYLAKFEAWMDDAKQDKYTTVEFAAPWFDVEPLPGVYIWQPLDKLADEAEKRGLKVVFRIHPIYSCIPSWIPREYQQDREGTAHGLWNASSSLVASPASDALRAGLHEYAHALASHFRNRACVIGYTLSNVMFDHGWLDQPYLNQYVDYSPSMTRYFVEHVKAKYGSLAAVAKAYGVHYATWDALAPPLPHFETDADGRLKPATSAIWRDWMDAKLSAMWASKDAMLSGLHSGDPACQVGFYADDALPYVSANYVHQDAFVADGSMEMMFPPALEPYPIRYEPIGKIARTAPLVDVGLTNLLSARPGWNSFNNYVFPQSRLSTLSATESEAESRLVEWFSVMDRLYGAKPLGEGASASNAAYLYSMESLFGIYQHTFAGRVEDPIKPYRFQAGAEKLKSDWIAADDVTGPSLAARPYVYVPYCADVLTAKVIDGLLTYVHNGGRLVIEPTSGYWLDGVGAPNALGRRLGLPPVSPRATPSASPDSVAASASAAMFRNVPVAFRVRPWSPPVETQPTPWIQNIPRPYLRTYRVGTLPQAAHVVARYPDGSPAAFTITYGKGEVLSFCGVVDWLSCKGLASAVDAWGRRAPWTGTVGGDPTLITSAFSRDGSIFIVGRRFIGHDEIAKVAGGIAVPGTEVSEARRCLVPAKGSVTYHVRDLVNATDLGAISGSELRTRGVDLSLKAGQGFLLEATPVITSAEKR